MLKINKILSKKIKSSLSLRGTKQRSNLKGFSLIELMVAVVIFAIAVIGIFLAFNNTWMGMANARDRTVATNYAREAMENVKNMDFELVTHENLGTDEPVGAKFTRRIIVNPENDNLKKITTKVFWTNRQDQEVSVETSMYINRTIFNPGEATHIILYADPYYTVLPDPDKDHAIIIAAIKDINNTTVIDWTGGDISFEIISEPPGDGEFPDGADTHVVAPTNGIAQTTFYGTLEGDVVIKASLELPNGGGTISDTITITVTSGVVRIALSAVPDSIYAAGTIISKVTAALVDSIGDTEETAVNPITFDIDILKEGIFVEEDGTPLGIATVTMNPIEGTGTAIIYVKSDEEIPGVATVTASSKGLLSGTVNIFITGAADSISVSVDPDLIYTDDEVGAEVTVEIQDVSGNPAGYDVDISLTIDGTGTFGQNPVNPAGTSKAYTTFYPDSPGIVTITARSGDLAAGSATIEVREALIADTIILKANPKNILAGGLEETDVSVITATIKQGSTVISNYDHDITFKIISDTSSSYDASLSLTVNGTPYGLDSPLTLEGDDYGNDGIAVVYLNPASYVGICTIEVSTYNSDDLHIVKTIEVGFYSGEDYIELEAVPPKMLVNGDTCIVTATVKDENKITVVTYEEDITFTILVGWPKIAKFTMTGTSSLTKTLNKGATDVGLIAQSNAGTVTLKAISFTDITNITGYLNISVVTTLLELAPDPKINYEGNQVSFDIEVHDIEVLGTVISLEEMQVSWLPDDSETLDTIEIKIGEIAVYSNDYGVTSGTVVGTVATLPSGIYTINLYFNESAVMSGKTLEVIFNPNSGNYPVEINEP